MMTDTQTELAQLRAELNNVKKTLDLLVEYFDFPNAEVQDRSEFIDPGRAELIGFLAISRSILGDDARVIPSQSAFLAAGFKSMSWRSSMVKQLIEEGIVNDVKRGVGGGTWLAKGRTLAQASQALMAGDADRPTPDVS